MVLSVLGRITYIRKTIYRVNTQYVLKYLQRHIYIYIYILYLLFENILVRISVHTSCNFF